MNLTLIQDGYLPAIVPPVLRGDYVSLLEWAHREDRDFIEVIVEREFESQKETEERIMRWQSAGCRNVSWCIQQFPNGMWIAQQDQRPRYTCCAN